MSFVDMHCDTLTALLHQKGAGTLYENTMDVDALRLLKMGPSMECFACFINLGDFKDKDTDAAYAYANQVMDGFDACVASHKDVMLAVKSAKDVRCCLEDASVVGAMLTVEEGGILGGSMERLDALFQRGVRLLTLTWNYENCLGYPNAPEETKMSLGLKGFGFEVVERMNQLGMLVDVSHLSDGGFWDVARVSKKPFVASHSNGRAVCPHPRNLTDAMLRALAHGGGVAGLNFFPRFVDENASGTVAALMAQVRHMVNVGGEDVVAIGTDFDGFFHEPGSLELEHAGQLAKLHDALCREFPQRIVDKIWYGNALRVMEDVLPQK